MNEVASANVGRMMTMCWGKTLGPLLQGHSSPLVSGLTQSVAGASTNTKLALAGGAAATGIVAQTGIAFATGLVGEAGIAAAGAFMVGTPAGWVLDALIGVAILGGILYLGSSSEKGNMIEVMPVELVVVGVQELDDVMH